MRKLLATGEKVLATGDGDDVVIYLLDVPLDGVDTVIRLAVDGLLDCPNAVTGTVSASRPGDDWSCDWL